MKNKIMMTILLGIIFASSISMAMEVGETQVLDDGRTVVFLGTTNVIAGTTIVLNEEPIIVVNPHPTTITYTTCGAYRTGLQIKTTTKWSRTYQRYFTSRRYVSC